MNSKQILFGLVALCSTLFIGTAASAADWPDKPVRIVVPFGPGSTPDAVARIVADKLQQRLGQPVIVENRGGAGGMIGTDVVARAVPDGHTIGIGSIGPLANNALIYKNMTYDPLRDLRPITKAVSQPSLLVVRGDFPAENVTQLLEELARHPDRYNYASIGNASLSHLTMELLAQRKGLDLVHVVYAGSGEALPALVGGHADMAVLPALVVRPMLEAKRVKVMAAAEGSALLPGIPTFKELGLADFDIGSWFGFFASAKVPDDIIERLHGHIVAVLQDPAVEATLNRQLMTVVADTPEEFSAALNEEQAMWRPVIEALDLQLD